MQLGEDQAVIVPVQGLILKPCFASNERIRWVVQWSGYTIEMQRMLELGENVRIGRVREYLVW